MKREDQPIIIVGETGIDLLLHVVRLAAKLRAHVRHLDRLAVLVFTLVGDSVSFGLPGPGPRDFEYRKVEGVADSINLPERIQAISLGKFFHDWRTFLRPGYCRQ